ncbi:MAG: diguanylate cyclase, partial [Gallionellaceae bacterium]|nr:diguanylate cyclase [Gallionellaceae bacterium]
AITPDLLLTIGIRSLRQLVLAFSLVGHYRHGRCRGFDYVDFWSRSLARAVACQRLAAVARAAPASEMFTCGLLAHVGVLALASIHPEKYSELQEKQVRGKEILRLEREALGVTHAEITVALLGDWGFPKLFTAAIAVAETPELADFALGSRTGRILVCQVLAEGLATALLGNEMERASVLPELLPWAEKLDLDAEQLVALTEEMRKDWQEWSRLLEIAVRKPNTITADDLARTGGAVATMSQAERLSVLVVDDDAATRMLLKKLLLAAGHAVHVAADGREGFRLAQEMNPDLMIVVWSMPEMDGPTLIRTLRGTAIGDETYIVMLTAYEENERLVEAFEAGADDFISKPINPHVLQARLSAGLRAIGARRALKAESNLLRANVKDLSLSEREAWNAALTDPLTGLYNRRHAVERLLETWAAANRTAHPLSVILVDLDRFKTINDTYGHPAGDAVLRQFAEILRGDSRLPDVACRIGGEEFLVLLPDTALDGAMSHAERIRLACEAARFAADGGELMVTASFGVAEKTVSMSNYEELLNAADRALYAAKQQGRNRVVAAAD